MSQQPTTPVFNMRTHACLWPSRAADCVTRTEGNTMNTEARTSPNLDQIRDQQRETWDKFSAGWKKWDAMVLGWIAPFGEAMIRYANLREDSNVLDIASGTGEPGLTAASLVPRGRVKLTDLAEHMLEVAAEKAAQRGLRNVETRVCEAGALPFADASLDAVLCRFGFMFFPDMAVAAREFARVAKPGARISAAVWGEPQKNPWATTIMDTIARHVDLPAPPPGAPGLFRCAAPGAMPTVFAAAGLRDIVEEELACDMVVDSPERYWEIMTEIAAPVVAGLARADEVTQARIREEVIERARQFVNGGIVRFPSMARVIAGTR
jgi:ubiquinone/menaquinone biosynthesis C-methylase UbiE